MVRIAPLSTLNQDEYVVIENQPPAGDILVEGGPPLQGWTMTVDPQFTDPDGIQPGTLSYEWGFVTYSSGTSFNYTTIVEG